MIGAISEAIGEYGGKVVLATPIEAILGNPGRPAAAPAAQAPRAGWPQGPAARRAAHRLRA